MIYIENLLQAYHENEIIHEAEILKFSGVENQDVYNITAPFSFNNEKIIAGRIESRDSEQSTIGLFREKEKNSWYRIPDSIDLELQDPFFTIINGEMILGGVEVIFSDNGKAKWRTIFYQLENIYKVNEIFVGPWGMKDLRLKQLNDGRILIMTRPQGKKGGLGKIGTSIIRKLNEISIEKIEETSLLCNQFCDEEWGGANEIYEIDDDIWVLGHIANFDQQGNRHYYAMVFRLDIENNSMIDSKIIATRKDFAASPTKRPDLEDVVFSGGLEFINNQFFLYAGISDAGAQKLRIKNPFE